MILSSKYPGEAPEDAFHVTILKRMLQFHKDDPHKSAFIQSETGWKISFKELYDQCHAFAGWLTSNGFKKGDIILLCLHNSWQFVVGCLGSWLAGLTVSPSSPQFGQFELSYQLKDSGAVLILTDQACLPVVSAVCKDNETIICVSDCQIKGTVWFESCLKSRPLNKGAEIDSDKDLILLPYSSGTTGTPKGVMITFTNYAYMLSSYVAKYRAEYVSRGFDDIVPPPIVVTFLPLYHAMGLFGMFWNIWLGSTQIMMTKFNIERYLEHIQEYAIVTLALVPSIVIQLANSPLLDKYDLSSVFLIATGSAPLSQSVVEKLKKRLPDVLFAQGYGMTETSVASHIGSPDAPPGSIGVLMPGTQMKVVNEDGKLCGPNEGGEMWLRGPQIMKGYWKRPKETAETFDKDGFMRTGDIVYYDQNGFTFVCDRLKELIKVHGKQVPPAELESVILELPTVQDCCVVGVEDERFGEVPRAFVVSSERNERAVQDHVNAKVAPYKRLRGGVVFVDALPRTPTGKLLRRQLREQAKSKHCATVYRDLIQKISEPTLFYR